jgi:hypothetical protein
MTAMMTHDRVQRFPEFNRQNLLVTLSNLLDIPPHLEQEIRDKYDEIAKCLGAEDSVLLPFSPNLYPQGSMRLGTVIRPILPGFEYDLDLVCCLRVCTKENMTQDQLKALVGLRLKQKYPKNLKESQRCWTLQFNGYHIDILPAMPNPDRKPTGIHITDTKQTRWLTSNPIAYHEWFKIRQLVQVLLEKSILAKARGVTVDQIPDYQVRTPLQRAVQILKRHRDIYSANDLENQPVSIIITTLAAHAYDNNADLEQTLLLLSATMKDHIEQRDGVYWVANPTDPGENFADKWRQHPERAQKFFAWLEQLNSDFSAIGKAEGIHTLSATLEKSFGGELNRQIIEHFGNGIRLARENGQLRMSTTGLLSTTMPPVFSTATLPLTIKVKDHAFHGED